MQFTAEKRVDYTKPDLTVVQVAKDLGAAWRDMSDKEKKPYVTKAAKDKKRYEKELAEFEKAGGVMQVKAKKAKTTKASVVKKPRAPSAYNLFMKERMTELKKSSDK